MAKVNATEGKVKIEGLAPLNRAERRRTARADKGDGQHPDYPLTEAEKIQVAVLIEKMNTLQAQIQQVQVGLSGLITSIVELRGLDPKKFGVNLAAGKILPVDAPAGSEVETE